MRRPIRHAAALLLTAVLLPAVARAAGVQRVPVGTGVHVPAGCTWDRCALRSWGAGAVVAGRPLDMTAVTEARAALAAAGGDVTREWALANRASRQQLWIGGVGLAAVLGTYAYYSPKHEREWRPAPGVGLPLVVVGSMIASSLADEPVDHVRRAVWLYDAALPNDTGTVLSTCPYARCALALDGGRLVRGAQRDPVHDLDTRAGGRALFAAAGDSAVAHYEAYLDARHGSALAAGITLGALAGSAASYYGIRNGTGRGIAIGLLGVGYVVGVSAGHNPHTPTSELERAVWFYNRTLPTDR